MAEKDKPESGAEGTKTGDEGTAPGSGGSAGTEPAEEKSGKTEVLTLTQDQLDAIIERRLAKAKDPEQERKAAEFDRLEREGQSATERLQREKDEAERTSKARLEAADLRLKSAEIRVQAAQQGVRADAIDLVVEKLLASEDIAVSEDGVVSGVDKAVTDLIKKLDFLKAPETSTPPPKSGGEFGGTDGKTIDQQIAELEAKGDSKSLRDARRLKLAKYETRTRT